MIERMRRRTKKAIVNNLEKLIIKYGFDEVRAVVNHYFLQKRENSRLEKEINEQEILLQKMKHKMEI